MKAKRILVPTDFSPCSRTALSLAVALASGDHDASISLIHVTEASVPTYSEDLGVLEPESLRTEAEMLAATRGKDVTIDAQVIHGDPKTKIIEFAEAHDIDLIVLGTTGRTGVSKLLMGSTAEAVMRRAKCPVITVRSRTASSAD